MLLKWLAVRLIFDFFLALSLYVNDMVLRKEISYEVFFVS